MKKTTLQPTYMNSFSCNPFECYKTCCSEWKIDIDKSNYEKIMKCGDKDFIKKFKENTSINEPKAQMNRTYAEIKLNEDKMCMFLDKDGLCEIHKDKGPSYLNLTCKEYPRHYRIIDDVLEMSLSPSCSVAARLILLNKNGIEFSLEETECIREIEAPSINTNIDSHIANCSWEIRSTLIEILQFREIPLIERLTAIGFFLNELNTSSTSEEVHSIIEKVKNSTANRVYSGILNNSEDDIRNTTMYMLKIANAIENMIESSTAMDSYKTLSKTANRIIIDDNNHNIELYLDTKKNKYKPFFYEYEYIFENYLVNFIFDKYIVLSRHEDIFNAFTLISFRIGMINMILTSLFAEKHLSPEECVDHISIIARQMDHNRSIDKFIIDIFEKFGFNSLPHLLTFILV